MAHYHYGSNTPGYLSEGDIGTAFSKSAAILATTIEVRRYRESQYEDFDRRDRRTGHGSAKDGYVIFTRPGDPYDLGLVFWWERCAEPARCGFEENA